MALILSIFIQDIDVDDEKTLELFMPKDVPKRITLADIILDKIKEKETEIASQISVTGSFFYTITTVALRLDTCQSENSTFVLIHLSTP